MENIVVSCESLGREIRAELIFCGKDASIIVTGGELHHVGSVSVAKNGHILGKWVGEGHRDDAVSDKFAILVSKLTGNTVSVTCGIHYDGISYAEIQEVLRASESLLDDILAKLQ